VSHCSIGQVSCDVVGIKYYFVSVQKLSSSSSWKRKAIGFLWSSISLLLYLLMITTVAHNL